MPAKHADGELGEPHRGRGRPRRAARGGAERARAGGDRDSLRRRAGGGAIATHAVGDVNAPLSVRMSHEYAVCGPGREADIFTASLMVAILFVLDILVNVVGLTTL